MFLISKLMFNDYKCPKCYGNLQLGQNLILSAQSEDKKGAIILLHPELGNYAADYHPDTKFDEGDKVTFYCPICHHDLTSNKHANLSMVIMVDENGKEYDIYFSQIAGEQSTIKMLGEHVEIFGTHTNKYLDFFNLSQMY